MGRRITDVTSAEFDALFTGFEHTAYRLETLQAYDVSYEEEPYRAFLAGHPQPHDPAKNQWVSMIGDAVRAGKVFQRVHVVREPQCGSGGRFRPAGCSAAWRLQCPCRKPAELAARLDDALAMLAGRIHGVPDRQAAWRRRWIGAMTCCRMMSVRCFVGCRYARAVVPTTVQPASEVQSTTTPPVKLISLAVMVRAQSDAANAAMLATSS